MCKGLNMGEIEHFFDCVCTFLVKDGFLIQDQAGDPGKWIHRNAISLKEFLDSNPSQKKVQELLKIFAEFHENVKTTKGLEQESVKNILEYLFGPALENYGDFYTHFRLVLRENEKLKKELKKKDKQLATKKKLIEQLKEQLKASKELIDTENILQ